MLRNKMSSALKPSLWDAAYAGDVDAARLLLSSRANPNEPSDGLKPLHAASARGHAKLVALLCDSGAAVNADDGHGGGITALHSASWNGRSTAICSLLEAKASALVVEARSGQTPLHQAAQAGHREACGLLIAAGSPLEAASARGATPLMTALEEAPDTERLCLARYLIERGADASLLDLLHRDELSEARTREAGASSAQLLLPVFAEQASRMPRYLHRLLVENAPPSHASPHALLRALRLPEDQWQSAIDALQRPEEDLLMRVPEFLDAHACALLRAAVDEHADPSRSDSVRRPRTKVLPPRSQHYVAAHALAPASPVRSCTSSAPLCSHLPLTPGGRLARLPTRPERIAAR